MILHQVLTCVSYGCIYMSYASRHSCSTGAAPQSLPNPASGLFITLRGRSTARQIVFHFSTSGLSISQAGRTLKASRSHQPPQDCLHRQTAVCALVTVRSRVQWRSTWILNRCNRITAVIWVLVKSRCYTNDSRRCLQFEKLETVRPVEHAAGQ
jgi:hypothetical protein